MSDNGFAQETRSIAGVDVRLQSYKVGNRWAAKIETLDVGNSIGRGMADTREEAERIAVESAKVVLELRSATAAFRSTAERLKEKA